MCFLDDRISTSVESCGRATLAVLRTEPSDTGRYAVELQNEHGKDRMFSSVTIEGFILFLFVYLLFNKL